MKQLEQLVKQASPLKSLAGELQSALTQVALLGGQTANGETFLQKEKVIETIGASIEKMQQLADLLSDLCSEKMSEDAIVFVGVSEAHASIQDANNKLGAVLDELVTAESIDDDETKSWMMKYVAEARIFLSCLKSDLT